MIGSIKKKEEYLSRQRDLQVKGLFKPKVTHYIPNSIIRTFKQDSKKGDQSMALSGNLNVVYYARSNRGSATKPDKSPSRSLSRNKNSNQHINYVHIDKRNQTIPSQLIHTSNQ